MSPSRHERLQNGVEERPGRRPRRPARRDVSDGRKGLYLLGQVMSGVGFVLFLSVFVSGACAMNRGMSGDFPSMHGGPEDFSSFPIRAVGGFLLIFVGQIVRSVGARGIAGSGVILDPEQAREDLEPFSRQAGGMFDDALDETVVADSFRRNPPPLPDDSEPDFEVALRKLHKLHADGILTDEEYATQKREILDRI